MIGYNDETARRYFRKHIFCVHQLKGGVGLQSFKGSVIVRHQSMLKIKTQYRRLSLDDIGSLFDKICGKEDELVIFKLKDSVPIDEIVRDIVHMSKDYLEKGTLP